MWTNQWAQRSQKWLLIAWNNDNIISSRHKRTMLSALDLKSNMLISPLIRLLLIFNIDSEVRSANSCIGWYDIAYRLAHLHDCYKIYFKHIWRIEVHAESPGEMCRQNYCYLNQLLQHQTGHLDQMMTLGNQWSHNTIPPMAVVSSCGDVNHSTMHSGGACTEQSCGLKRHTWLSRHDGKWYLSTRTVDNWPDVGVSSLVQAYIRLTGSSSFAPHPRRSPHSVNEPAGGLSLATLLTQKSFICFKLLAAALQSRTIRCERIRFMKLGLGLVCNNSPLLRSSPPFATERRLSASDSMTARFLT